MDHHVKFISSVAILVILVILVSGSLIAKYMEWLGIFVEKHFAK